MAKKEFSVIEIIEQVNLVVAADARRVALRVLQSVVFSTPVGNPTRWQFPESAPKGYVGGHARRNWNVSLSVPRDTVTGQEGKGGGPGASASESIAAGRSKILRYKQKNTRIIIQNNVPYIGRLNAGHSTAAPANFVEKAVQRGVTVGGPDRRELD